MKFLKATFRLLFSTIEKGDNAAVENQTLEKFGFISIGT